MKVWTMTRTSIYAGTGEVYLVTTAHTTYRGAVKSARAELEYFGKEYVGDNKRALIAEYAAGRRRACPDDNWLDAQKDGCRVVISIDCT